MEDFIEEIYKHSFIISDLKEFLDLLDAGHYKQARDLYNELALNLERWLEEIAVSDPVTASSIQETALLIKDQYDDQGQCKGLIEGRLIPALYKCMVPFNSIDVSEGKYTLKSSDSGFLTVYDNDINTHLHDLYDPMHEARRKIANIYKPEMEGFMILGCGLGYEAYQAYHQSDGAIRIYLYEEDKTILSYASLYGVLSLIPKDNIEIISNSTPEDLAKLFLYDINSRPSFGYHIAPFKHKIYNGVCDNELNRIIINHDYSLDSSDLSIINLWKNKKLNRISFHQVVEKYHFKEYIIISAGPSLDDSLDFIKSSKGKRGLIAVNTVLRRLLDEGIVPDIIAAADFAGAMSKHLEGIESYTSSITLIADWLLSWKYTTLYKGDICFVRTNASAGLTEDYLPNDPVWDISGTVACLAVETAVSLGAEKIYLAGQDLAYPSGQMYAKGMPHKESDNNTKWSIRVPSVNGELIYTCEAFEWFRKALEFQIKKYNDIDFVNLSRIGALIKGALPYDQKF